jgi:hypothetical protein
MDTMLPKGLLRSSRMDLFSISTFFGFQRLARQAKQNNGYTRGGRTEDSWYGVSIPTLTTAMEAELMRDYDDRINEALRGADGGVSTAAETSARDYRVHHHFRYSPHRC